MNPHVIRRTTATIEIIESPGDEGIHLYVESGSKRGAFFLNSIRGPIARAAFIEWAKAKLDEKPAGDRLTDQQIDSIHDALAGLKTTYEFQFAMPDGVRIDQGDKTIADIREGTTRDSVVFAMLNASRAIDQLRWPRIGYLECGHPETSIGKVNEDDNNETPHCLWCGDIQDMGTLVQHVTTIYDWATNGRISKPMTLPSEVIAVAEDMETERTEAAIKAALKEKLGPEIMEVIINGRESLAPQESSYSRIVKMAFPEAQPTALFSVTFSHGPEGRWSGILAPGEDIEVVDGMRFDVADTSNA
jgi:hypothetical protein